MRGFEGLPPSTTTNWVEYNEGEYDPDSNSHRLELILWPLMGEIGPPRGRMLDFGGGSGELTVRYLSRGAEHVYLMEPDPTSLMQAEVACADLPNVSCTDTLDSIEPESLRYAVASFSMMYSKTRQELRSTYRKLYDLLAESGMLTMVVPDPRTIHLPLHNGFRSFPESLNGELDYSHEGERYYVHLTDRSGEVITVIKDNHFTTDAYEQEALNAGFSIVRGPIPLVYTQSFIRQHGYRESLIGQTHAIIYTATKLGPEGMQKLLSELPVAA